MHKYTDDWMGDIEHIKVSTVEGDTSKPIQLYRKLTVAANKLSFLKKICGNLKFETLSVINKCVWSGHYIFGRQTC